MAYAVITHWLGLILTKHGMSLPQGHDSVTEAMASSLLQGVWLAQSSIEARRPLVR
jgi:hypothetical protein